VAITGDLDIPTDNESWPLTLIGSEFFRKHSSVDSTRDETFLSLLGFPCDTISYLWKQYGNRVKIGTKPLNPIRFMWFLSYLRTGLTWAHLSLLWRVPITTLRTTILSTISQLEPLVDEVQNDFKVNWSFFFRFPDFFVILQIHWSDTEHNLPKEGPFKGYSYIVDCTELEMSRPNDKEEEIAIFSHKPSMCAIKYEGMTLHEVFYQI